MKKLLLFVNDNCFLDWVLEVEFYIPDWNTYGHEPFLCGTGK